ncbi:hypothetical protein AURDEDRAFT_124230 [Auricularia subglabra TFB-10046 SS5]|nr:hypothetical protein AURDEDRAFT_124230 [Auricularia subglabra TFB-10046 SS5]
MVYFYVQTSTHPLPRGAINRTYRGLTAFTAFTFIFGYAAGLVDSVLIVNALRRCSWYQRSRRTCCPWSLYWAFFWIIGVIVMLVFGMAGVVISLVIGIPTYRHACEKDWITVLLEGNDYDNRTAPNRATFSLSANKEPLFMFTSQDPDRWQFNLDSLGSAHPSVLPALRNITFDDPKLAVSGLCYGDNSTTPCMTGRYDPVVYLSFDITNSGARSRIRSPYREWSLDDVLSVILQRVEDDGSLSDVRVLQTSPPKPMDCKQLKVCIAHPRAPTNVLGADILAALGWLMGTQGDAAAECTKPRGNAVTVF